MKADQIYAIRKSVLSSVYTNQIPVSLDSLVQEEEPVSKESVNVTMTGLAKIANSMVGWKLTEITFKNEFYDFLGCLRTILTVSIFVDLYFSKN